MNTQSIDILEHKRGELSRGACFYVFTPKQLRMIGASQFSDGDIILVGKYYIHIEYGPYGTPSFGTWVETRYGKSLDCTPGAGTPYYIDDFKHR